MGGHEAGNLRCRTVELEQFWLWIYECRLHEGIKQLLSLLVCRGMRVVSEEKVEYDGRWVRADFELVDSRGGL